MTRALRILPLLAIFAFLTAPARAEITPLPRVVALRPASTLVLPVRLSDPRDRLTIPPCRFERTEIENIELVWFAVTEGQGVRTPLRAWLDVDRTWRTIPAAEAGAGDGVGFWALCLRVPDSARGSLWIADRMVLTRWLDSDLAPFPPIHLTRDLAAALEEERTDPYRYWHARLALQNAPAASFNNEKLTAWAEGLADSWRLALTDLHATDPNLARQLTNRLWRTAHLAGQVEWSLWPTSPAALQDLLEILLDPTRTPDRRAAIVELWLEEQPRVLTWMIEPFAEPGPTVTLLNLTDKPEIAWLSEQSGVAASPRELPPGEMTPVTLPAADAPATWEIRTTDRTTRVPVAAGPIAMRPPGAILGPLLSDWTLESFQNRAPAAPTQQVRAMLYRVPIVRGATADAAPNTNGSPPGVLRRYQDRVHYIWRIHLEAQGDAIIHIWLGPQNSPRHVLRCSNEGWIADARRNAARQPIPVVHTAERWTMQIDLPSTATEPDGTLHIGLERLTPRGERSTWPAARLPWDNEPARMIFSPNTWLGFHGD